jgi:hypothetical protein
MWSLDLGQNSNVVGHGLHDKGRTYMGGMGLDRKPKHENIWCPHATGINTETLKW